MASADQLNVYSDENQLITIVEPIYEADGYWKPIAGKFEWSNSEDMRLTVEFVWHSEGAAAC